MIISTKKKAPFKGGRYQTIINDVKDGKKAGANGDGGYLKYNLTVFVNGNPIEITTFISKSHYSFDTFANNLVNAYGEGCDTDDHIGTTVNAEFEINKAKDGNEYVNLIGYEPYSEVDEDEVEDDDDTFDFFADDEEEDD